MSAFINITNGYDIYVDECSLLDFLFVYVNQKYMRSGNNVSDLKLYPFKII